MTDQQEPIVLHLGKQAKKRIKALKQSHGPLAEEIMRLALEEAGGAAEQDVVPIVVLYEEKPKRKKLRSLIPGF